MALAAPQPLGGHLQLNGVLEGGAAGEAYRTFLKESNTTKTGSSSLGVADTLTPASASSASSPRSGVAWAPMAGTMNPDTKTDAAANGGDENAAER